MDPPHNAIVILGICICDKELTLILQIKLDQNCSKDLLIKAEVKVHNENQTFFDVFKITSNNRTVLSMNFNGLNRGEQTAILQPAAINIFDAVTYSSRTERDASITLSTVEGTNIGGFGYTDIPSPNLAL